MNAAANRPDSGPKPAKQSGVGARDARRQCGVRRGKMQEGRALPAGATPARALRHTAARPEEVTMLDDVNAARENLSVALDDLLHALSDAVNADGVTMEQSMECDSLHGYLLAIEQDWIRVADRIDGLS